MLIKISKTELEMTTNNIKYRIRKKLKLKKNSVKQFLLLYFLFIQFFLSAQKEGNIWHFGFNAGIDFNSGSPVAITNGSLSTWEGSASICDNTGALLFYTDGVTVYNKNHEIMQNGTGLMGNFSTTQSALIVKKPDSKSNYYIFTLASSEDLSNGFRYSEVDMTLNGGLGAITVNKNILVVTPACEKIAAIKHQNNNDFWIVIHLFGSDTFNSFLLNSSGLNIAPIVSKIGVIILPHQNTLNSSANGYLKCSSNGKKIASANMVLSNVEVFDFDNANGILSNAITISGIKGYGVEFSPNSRLLYVSNFSNLVQFNLLAGSTESIINSKTIVGSVGVGALQLAPDGKIYKANYGKNALDVINTPNSLGTACNYLENGFDLGGRRAQMGLPTFYNSIYEDFISIKAINFCFGDSTIFSYYSSYHLDSVLWNFDDPISGNNNYSRDSVPTHVFSLPGIYNVRLIVYSGNLSDTLFKLITINLLPKLNLGKDTTICNGETILLNSLTPNATYLWRDSSKNPTLRIAQMGTYWVTLANSYCSISDTINVFVENCACNLYLPNAFTPNANNKNDFFSPISDCDFEDFNFVIFNRWGEKIFESNNFTYLWDGTYQNSSSPIGVYAYLLSVKQKGRRVNLNGTVTLLK